MFRIRTNGRNGFTIVELLIVIVVIAILAAIVVIAYNGIKNRAVEASMQSDLRNAATQVESEHSMTGSYPTDGSTVNEGAGLKASSDNTLNYASLANGYCVSVTSTQLSGSVFHISNAKGTIETGPCPTSVATVTTIAGSGTPGYANGSGSAARFNFFNDVDSNHGWGIDIDNEGMVYIADHGNNVIRQVTPTGTVSTFAGMVGDGGEIITSNGLTSSFNYPFDLFVVEDDGEEFLVVSTGCIRLVGLDDPNHGTDIINGGALVPHDGHQECAYGTNDSSSGWGTMFRDPISVVVDSDLNIYVNEVNSGKVRKMSFDTGDGWWELTNTLTSAGAFDSQTRFGIDSQNRIYGASGNKIVRFTSLGVRSDFAGNDAGGFVDATGSDARFNAPAGVDVDANGNVYVAECDGHRIRKITPAGEVSTVAGSGTEGGADGVGTSAQFRCPIDVAVSSDGSTAYVIDAVEVGDDVAGYVRKLTF